MYKNSFVPKPVISTVLAKYKDGTIISERIMCKSEIVYIDETGFGVYWVENEKGETFKTQGVFMGGLREGSTYDIKGKIVTYKGESQLRTYEYSPCKPVTKKGIIAYLKTLYGLKSKADLIYDEFGDESIDILIKNPTKVSEKIKGIGKKSVVRWQEQLKELSDNQELFLRLLGYGISHKNAHKLLDKYGEKIVSTIDEDPFLLTKEVKGYGFLKCDKIFLESGKSPENESRIRASIMFVLEQSKMEGHCYLPLEELLLRVSDLLSIKLNIIEMTTFLKEYGHLETVSITKHERNYTIDIKLLKEKIAEYNSARKSSDKENAKYVLLDVDIAEISNQINFLISNKDIIYDESKIYLKSLFFAELSFAKHIKRLAVYDECFERSLVEKILDDICSEKNIVLEEAQRKACIEFNLSNSGVYLLIGSAGTGKTFVMNLIIEVGERLEAFTKTKIKSKILAVAPTGKASKVASKSIGRECFTVHRSLEFNPENGFNKNEENPYEEDKILCDESSMLDIELANNFVKAISTGSRVFFLGDIKQLPSVGPGNVLRDLIDSGIVKVVVLDVIKRQGVLSGIVATANKVIANKMICSEPTKDMFFMETDSITQTKNKVIRSIERILTFEGYTLDEIQVLLPQRTGALGVHMFNYVLQNKFNPDGINHLRILKGKFDARINEESPIETFPIYIQKGDKVIHIKNNYGLVLYEKDMLGNYRNPRKIGVTNGECGVVEDIVEYEKDSLRVIVKYDNYYAFYDDGVDELELCYATTIHKSQGSAWKAVILPIVAAHTNMLSNNLFYTGITRARDFLVIVGSKKAVWRAINTHKVSLRYTGLRDRLLK